MPRSRQVFPKTWAAEGWRRRLAAPSAIGEPDVIAGLNRVDPSREDRNQVARKPRYCHPRLFLTHLRTDMTADSINDSEKLQAALRGNSALDSVAVSLGNVPANSQHSVTTGDPVDPAFSSAAMVFRNLRGGEHVNRVLQACGH